MAKPTSASDRSKRKSSQPVTKGQNPQRANRQKVSNAKVTNDGGRGSRGTRVTNASQRTNTGSARVTGTTPKAHPPGKPGGQLAVKPASPNQRQLEAQAKLNKAAKGSAGPNRVGQPAGAANRVYGANVVNNAVQRAQSSARLGRNISVKRGGAAATALGALNMVDDARLTPAQRAKKYEVVNPDRGQNLLTKFQSGTLGQRTNTVKRDPNGRSSQGINTSKGRTVATGSQQYNNSRNQQLAAERERLKDVGNAPKPPKPPAPRPADTQPGRPAASRPSTPAAPKNPAAPAAPKDRRVSASTANRESGNYGTSRTNNPMIDDAMKGRMRQREDAAGVGPLKDGARYAADVKSNTQGVGPIKDGERYASNAKPSNKSDNNAIAQKSGSEKLKDALEKQREKQKQQQQQRLISARRPGSRY